jgi:hypothetical protein
MARRKTVKLGGRKLQVATKLSAATNAKRGYCQTCSGLGTRGATGKRKARPCEACSGTGRTAKPTAPATTTTGTGATDTSRRARPSADTVAARRAGAANVGGNTGPRTAYGAAAAKRTATRKTKKKQRTVLRLFGIGGKRLPVNKALRTWTRSTFGTRTTTSAQGRARAGATFGQVIAIGEHPGSAWWRCPRCAATETGLRDGDTALGRAAAHWAGNHPGAPFRLDTR